jgi:hypothetical protein
MRRKLSYVIPALSVMALFVFHSNAKADDWDQKTLFTINQPVSIPGHVVLPAGSYVIKRLSTVGSAVQILNESETKVYATLLTIPEEITNPPDKPTFTFEETPEGPMALKEWYYPGSDTAYEFMTAQKSTTKGHGVR